MDTERVIAATALALSTIPTIVLGLSFRAGRGLHLISGVDLGKVRDRQGLGELIGISLLMIAGLLFALAGAVLLLPDDLLAIACVIAVGGSIVISVRLLFALQRFRR